MSGNSASSALDAAALKPAPGSLYAAMGLMTALWGMNFYAAKIVTSQFSGFLSAGLRSVFGAIAIGLYFFTVYRGSRETGGANQTLTYMGLGTIGIGLNQYFFMEGMSRTSVAHGALIISLTPVLVLILAVLVGQERFTAMKAAGLTLAISGVALLQTGQSGNSTLLGDALVLGAASSFATYTVLTKHLTAKSSKRATGITAVAYGFLGSCLAFLPGLAWMGPQVSLAAIEGKTWLALLYMSIAASVICYVIYYRALESMPASRVSALSYLQPLIAITTAIPLLGEPITKPLIVGGALILTGVLLAERG